MEVLAYIVGASIEMDLGGGDRRDWLATLTSSDALNATWAIVDKHGKNRIYVKNFQAEAKTPGNRIPPQGWEHWLSILGFMPETLEHIRAQATGGVAKTVDPKTLPK